MSKIVLNKKDNRAKILIIFSLYYLILAFFIIYSLREMWILIVMIVLFISILIAIYFLNNKESYIINSEGIQFLSNLKIKANLTWDNLTSIETGFDYSMDSFPVETGAVMLYHSNYKIILKDKNENTIIFGEGIDSESIIEAYIFILKQIPINNIEIIDKLDLGKKYLDDDTLIFIKKHKNVLNLKYPLNETTYWRKNSTTQGNIWIVNILIMTIIIFTLVQYFFTPTTMNDYVCGLMFFTIMWVSIAIFLNIGTPTKIGFNNKKLIVKARLQEFEFPWYTIRSISDSSAGEHQSVTSVVITTHDGKEVGYGGILREIIYEMQARFEEFLDTPEGKNYWMQMKNYTAKNPQQQFQYETRRSSSLNSFFKSRNLIMGPISEFERDITGKSSMKCNRCGNDLIYYKEVNSFYCSNCKKYFQY